MMTVYVRRSFVRTILSHIRALRPAAVMLATCCCLTAVNGQWLETTVVLPDSLGAFAGNSCHVWDSVDNKLFVGGDSGILVIDAASNKRLAIVPVEGSVRALCYSPVGHKVYCATDSGLIAVLSGVTNQLVATLPVGASFSDMCYNSRDNKVYTEGAADSSVVVIDCDVDTIVATVSGVPNPGEFCYASVHNKLYCDGGDEVTVVDCAGDSVVARLPASGNVRDLAYDPQDDKVYAAGFGYDTVAVINGATDSVTAMIYIDNEPFALCYDSRDNKMYCANSYSPWLLTVIDCAVDTVLAAIPVVPPSSEAGLCYNPRDNKLYCEIAPSNPAVVEIVDCAADSVVGEVIAECRGIGYNGTDDLVYCIDFSGNVTVVDGATDEVVAAVASTEVPGAFCYVPRHNKVYCACYSSRAVVVIDAETNALSGRIFTGPGSGILCYNPIDDKVYCVNELDATLTVIDAAADTVLVTLPDVGWTNALCYNSMDNKVYSSDGDCNAVVVDGVSDTILARVRVGLWPSEFCYGPQANKVYCQNYSDGTVTVIDGHADTVLATIEVGFAAALCYDSAGGNVYCSSSSDSCVAVIDGRGDSLLASVAVGRPSPSLCYDSRDNRIYCGLSGPLAPDSLAAIDCATNEVIARLRVPPGYWARGLCYAPEVNRIYYTNRYDTVAVIDAATSTMVAGVNVGMRPGDMVWNPAQGRLYVANDGGYISVLRDSGGSGLEGYYKPQFTGAKPAPTIIRGVLVLPVSPRPRVSGSPCLLDACGRKVLDLKPGENDVRALSPGVYFVREAQAQAQAQAVRKVVIAE